MDEQLLRALVRRELTEVRAREVYALVYAHKEWDESHKRILIEEFREQEGPLGQDP